MSERNLRVYLNDHLAGAVAATGLLERLGSELDDPEMVRELSELHDEVATDIETLRDLLRRLDFPESGPRKLAAAVLQKGANLKFRLEASKHGELQLLHALDSLSLGIEGKKTLWSALDAAAEREPRLRLADYGRLTERADDQLSALSDLRRRVARGALTGADSPGSGRLRPALALGVGLALAAAAAGALRCGRRLVLSGRTALVTGGSRGLGLCIAEELARRGARVAILAREPAELTAAAERLRALGAEPLTIAADVRLAPDAERAVTETVERFGGLDLLVNNAGVISVGPLSEMAVADFEDEMAVHFFGPLRLSLAALPHLESSGAGRIVNIASIGGRLPVPHMAPYSASKAALVGLSDALRSELAPLGVKVTTVCPGPMRTGSHLHARFKGDHRREATWFTASAVAPLLSLDPHRAARRIIEAARRGDAYLTFNAAASAAIWGEGLMPGAARRVAGLAARLLPASTDRAGGGRALPGWRVGTAWLPPALRARAERAARENLETVGIRAGAETSA